MNINDEKLKELYHDVEFLMGHMSEEIGFMESSLLDLKGIKNRLDDLIVGGDDNNDK